ncbi:MAG: arginine--tRNA ligase [Chloroflexi bacterium]|nr:arginine--tRNA ligase [Chloroflexota bacterium]
MRRFGLIRERIALLLKEAIQRAQAKGALPPVAVTEVALERPQKPEFGDYASTIPLKLSRAARMSPMAIGKAIVDEVSSTDLIGKVEAVPPGFINVTLSESWLANQVDAIIAAGPAFGDIALGRGVRMQIEFVSANPTGPLTAASGRGGALGDTLANVLSAAGFEVEREYFINDAGSRMEVFFQTVYARYAQALGQAEDVPPEGYHGTYVSDLAQEILREYGDRFLRLPRERATEEMGRIALDRMVGAAKRDLADMGVRYDCWFSEQSLYDSSLVKKTLELLRSRGFTDEREGALWFTSSALGEDKDNVLVRSNGAPTYFASDITYHYNKFLIRNYDQVIDILGADHQGHVPRMKAGVTALGVDPDHLTLIVHQMITLRRGDEIVRMSKRTGDIVSLREVLDEVGPDACRFFFLSRSADSQMDFDLDLAKRQSNENPVYYVQYAHARIASILRYAGDVDFMTGNVTLLVSEPEQTLIRKMLQLPELVEIAATRLEPHHLPYFAQDLAAVFHSFYKQCRVVSDDLELTRARLKLVEAAKIVLAKTLALMGVAAPEQM